LYPGDRPLSFEVHVQGPAHRLRLSADVASQVRVRPSEQFLAEVERLCGAGSVTLR
jgi:hypothetical protein